MNDLDDICGGGGDPSSMTLGQLRANCQDFGQAFGLSTVEIVLLILVLLVGLFWLLAARQRADADAATTVGNTIEGALYAAIGMFAGSGFGLVVAEVVPPDLLGTIFGLVGLVALFFAIRGAAKGDGETGGRVAAVVLGALLAALGVMLAIFAYAVPNSGPAGDEYQTYVNVVAISLGLLGALDGIVAALLRGPHWAAGWALVFLNSSWGFLGNILGLGTHLGSYLCWKDDGDPNRSNRKAYTLYRSGLTLQDGDGKPLRLHTGLGDVLRPRRGDLEVHEAIHVGQHFVLGPIYVVSHGIWDLLGAGIGSIAGLPRRWTSSAKGHEDELLQQPLRDHGVRDAQRCPGGQGRARLRVALVVHLHGGLDLGRDRDHDWAGSELDVISGASFVVRAKTTAMIDRPGSRPPRSGR